MVILMLFCLNVSGQDTLVYEPKILILSPSGTKVSLNLQKDFKIQSAIIAKNKAWLLKKSDPAELEGQPQNVEFMAQKSRKFLSKIDFFKQVSYSSYDYLVYRFYERFPNVLILLKDTVSTPDLASLQKTAVKEQMPYIINFPSIELSKDKNGKIAKIAVQLYELSSNSLLLNTVYKGSDRNPGFEFTCKDGSLGCTLNNALSGALRDIINQVAANNPTLKKERELGKERAKVIQTDLYPKPIDLELIKKVIQPADSSINLKSIYQCLYNTDQSKFIAFFAEREKSTPFKLLKDKKEKGKTTIITNRDIHDPGYLDSIPKTYAYIVKGVLVNGKWAVEKEEMTYFDAPSLEQGRLMYLNNLQKWGYFKEGSTEYSPEFWKGGLFIR